MRKAFDCVKMKHDIQEKLWEESKAQTLDELFSYIQRKAKDSPLYNKIRSL